MSYRVDNIPWVIRPVYLGISFLIAMLLYGLCAAIHYTCKIEFEGKGNLKENQNYIFCLWHQSLGAYFTVFLKHHEKHIWMNHPAWFMKPIHYWLWLIGIKELALGSSGNSGKEALQKVITKLKKGYFTVVNPDGPAGPPKILKTGVLRMSQEAGIPIIPVKISLSHFITLPTWDKKKLPLPFSTIRVVYGKPLIVSRENSEEAKKILELVLTDE